MHSTAWQRHGVVWGCLAVVWLAGCGQDGTVQTAGDGPLNRDALQADAGGDLETSPGYTVALDGSGSRISDGGTLIYDWKQTAGSILIDIVGPSNRPMLHFTAPDVDHPTTVEFTLTVSDGVSFVSDTVTVTIGEGLAQPSEIVFAAAGADRIVLESEVVQLDGRQSRGSLGGSRLSYFWSQRGGPPVELVGSDGAMVSFVAPLAVDGPAELAFRLEVIEGTEASVDTVTVTVLPANDGAGCVNAEDDPHPAVRFEIDRVVGAAPLKVNLEAVNTGGAPLPDGAALTWYMDDGTEQSGSMRTHRRISRIFSRPGIHTVGLCMTVGAMTWGCLDVEKEQLRRQISVWPAVTGRLTHNGRGVAGAVVSANNVPGGASAVTDANGYFTLEVPYGWSGVITPDHYAYSFDPPRVALNTVQTRVLNLSFSGGAKPPATDDPPSGPAPGDPAVVFGIIGCQDDSECGDGVFCNGQEQCLDGACVPGAPACPDQLCDEGQQSCISQACQTHAECSDGVFCNGREHCLANVCVPGEPPCTGQMCDEGQQACTAPLCATDADCDDGLFCNGFEFCRSGGCVSGPSICQNQDCDEAEDRCVDCFVNADCNDGLYCNGAETCSAGLCIAGNAPCAAGTSCDESANACLDCVGDADCDDGLFCNGAERCAAGQCQSGAAPCGGSLQCNEAANACESAGQQVVSMTLINATADQPIAAYDPLPDGAALNASTLPPLNLAANTNPAVVGSVRFELHHNGVLIHSQVEDNPPYALFGNTGGNYAAWPGSGPTPGSTYQVTATPYSGDAGAGTPGMSLALTFSFSQSGCNTSSDCDDGLFCNGAETCASGQCAAGSPPCPAGQPCDEAQNACAAAAAPCAGDAACDDGMFCNGAETCQQGQCTSSGNPCPAGQYCVESADACQAGTWQAPHGVPAPDFGIEEQAPPYSPNSSVHYYVDKTHPSASDSNNPNGAPSHPRLTIPMNLPAGALVIVRGGPYNYTTLSGKLYISGNGTPSQPIFIRGPGPDDRPVFSKNVYVKGSYIVFEHLLFDNYGFELRPLAGSLHHVAVRHCEFAGNGQLGGGGTIKVVGNPTPIHDVVLFNNHIHHNGDDALGAPELGRHGVLVSYNVERAWIVDNVIHDNGEDSVQINFHGSVSNKVPARFVYVSRNTMYSDRENAVDVKVAYDVVISENIIYDYRPTQTSNGSGIIIHTGQTTAEHDLPKRVWVMFNHIHDLERGVSVTEGQDIYIINNIINDVHHTESGYDPGSIYAGGVGIHARNSGPVYVAGNTLSDCDAGLTTNATVDLRGNIISDIAEPQSFHLNVQSGTSVTADHDLYYQAGGAARIRWGGTDYTFTGFRASTGRENHGMEANPQFVASGNFRLSAGSPAIDAGGALHPAYTTFANLYGVSAAVDFDGAPRPQGSAADIGAFER